jgi:uncharacterized membrane protein (UPF0127 family)
MKRILLVLLAMLTVAGPAAPVMAKPAVPSWRDHHPWSTEVATVTIGDVTIQAEIADTSPLQTRGLGYRDGLDPGTGMLFDFGSAAPRTFWMKGMRFCLDIIWIEGGEITGAAESVCPMPNATDAELPRYASGEAVSFVLEVPAGTMATHGWGAGTTVRIDLPRSAGRTQ